MLAEMIHKLSPENLSLLLIHPDTVFVFLVTLHFNFLSVGYIQISFALLISETT